MVGWQQDLLSLSDPAAPPLLVALASTAFLIYTQPSLYFVHFNLSLIKYHVLAESLDRVLTVSRGGSVHLIGIGNQGQESATRISFYLPWINEQYKKWKKLSLK